MKDILTTSIDDAEQQELYIMLSFEDEEGQQKDRTLIVKRTKLTFNDKTCQVVNFQDVTTFKRLKLVEEKSAVLNKVVSSVYHEMIGPLKNSVELAVQLVRSLRNSEYREMAQIILICNKQVMLRATDFLDQKLLENG